MTKLCVLLLLLLIATYTCAVSIKELKKEEHLLVVAPPQKMVSQSTGTDNSLLDKQDLKRSIGETDEDDNSIEEDYAGITIVIAEESSKTLLDTILAPLLSNLFSRF